jgi:hypothetical protein
MKVTAFTDTDLRIPERAGDAAQYKAGALCSYWFKYPLDARPGDGILITLTNLQNLKIYAAVGVDPYEAEGPLLPYKRNRK